MENKYIHFIGICGVAMSALALAMKKAGYKITGSDVGIYPPISTYLKASGVDYYTGWHPELMCKDGKPDLVVVGNVAGSNNPEWHYVQEKNIPYKSYPEIIAKYFVKENSIVCAGTYGKTTSTAILAWLFHEINYNPSYMFGGISLNDIPAAKLTEEKYSILEGDEYKSSRWDNGPKFAHYSPTHLLLTSVVWDHADVYPTEQSYVDAFANLLKNIPANGLVVLSAKVIHDQPQLAKLPKSKIVSYGKTKDNDYQYTDVNATKEGISFSIKHNSEIYNLKSEIIGDYMADNMTGCFALAHSMGIEPKKIIKSFASFKNIKRRLEKKYDGEIVVFDDIAHSPKKAEAVLKSLRHIYFESRQDGKSVEASYGELQKSDVKQIIDSSKDSSSPSHELGLARNKLVAIFEPNSGNRQPESIPGYDHAFASADEIIIPRLTPIKKDPNKPNPIEGQELADIIAKTHNHVKYIEDDDKLIDYLKNNSKAGDVIIFLGSHGFRGMIDQLVTCRQAGQNK